MKWKEKRKNSFVLHSFFRTFACTILETMSWIGKLFGKKEEEQRVGGMEDFMTLIRVYFQAVMAADLGITNLAALPDLRIFKQTYKVPTQNNKLGIAEKKQCQKNSRRVLSHIIIFLKIELKTQSQI